MTLAELWLQFARNLEAFRLEASALRAVDRVSPVTPAIDGYREYLKEKAKHGSMAPGMYFLVTIQDQGFVLPLGAEIRLAGYPGFLGSEAVNAMQLAFAAVSSYFGVSQMPAMSCVFPVDIGELGKLDGPSLGLAAALAFVQRASGRSWPFPVIVTGEIGQNRHIHPVGNIEVKLCAAMEELGRDEGKLVVASGTRGCSIGIQDDPRIVTVHTLDEAVQAIWGQRLMIQSQFVNLSDFLARIRRSVDISQNVTELMAALDELGTRADRARVLHELMIQFRHLGRTVEADHYSQQIKAILDDPENDLDISHIQEMEVQRLATELDLFPGPWFRDELLRLLQERLDPPNRVRVQGLLAMYESMNGNGEAAIAARERNLEIHRKRMDLHSEIPVTLCHLTWEAARAGRLDLFERYAHELADCSLTSVQWNYNYHALVGGAVHLNLHQEFCDFLEGTRARFFGASQPLREFFQSNDPVQTHPQISTLRALIRLCRRVGNLDEAVRLGRRFIVKPLQNNLTSWLFVICGIENDLAWYEKDGSNADSIRQAPEKLQYCHKQATAYYPNLIGSCSAFAGSRNCIRALELELDRLYY